MYNFKPLLILLCVAFVFCKNQTTEQKPASSETKDGLVEIEAFESLMKSDHILIDVRTPEEFAAGHISSAQNINYHDEGFDASMLKLDKDKPILLYCKSGGRSGKTYSMLKANNFSKVYDLKGGFTAWQEANKPFSK